MVTRFSHLYQIYQRFISDLDSQISRFPAIPRIDMEELEHLEKSSTSVLYGAGRLGELSANLLPKYFDYICDSSLFALQRFPRNLISDSVEIDNLINIDSQIIVYISITKSHFSSIVQRLKEKNPKNRIFHIYDLLAIKTSGVFDNFWTVDLWSKGIEAKVLEVFTKLSDIVSRSHYLAFLIWHVEGLDAYDILSRPFLASDSAVDYFAGLPETILNKKLSDLNILDVGSSDDSFIVNISKYFPCIGLKIKQFDPLEGHQSVLPHKLVNKSLVENSHFNYALTFERGEVGFNSQLGMASRINHDGNSRVTCFQIDDFGMYFDIIKIHVEGSEVSVLEGARQTLRLKPLMVFVTVYHNSDGIYLIETFLQEILGDGYDYYFHNHGYSGVASIFKAIRK